MSVQHLKPAQHGIGPFEDMLFRSAVCRCPDPHIVPPVSAHHFPQVKNLPCVRMEDMPVPVLGHNLAVEPRRQFFRKTPAVQYRIGLNEIYAQEFGQNEKRTVPHESEVSFAQIRINAFFSRCLKKDFHRVRANRNIRMSIQRIRLLLKFAGINKIVVALADGDIGRGHAGKHRTYVAKSICPFLLQQRTDMPVCRGIIEDDFSCAVG